MAFRQHRPQPARQLSFQLNSPQSQASAASPAQRKRPLEESEEWVLFSPAAPSTTARTHTTSTDRTARTAGLSRLSDFGSLDTAARSPDGEDTNYHGTEDGEELDSLDDGLHAFHDPSEYGAPAARLQQSGETVLPTHDGLGTFQPNANLADHMWQFERQVPRRRARRRSSVQRRLDALEETEEVAQERDRRQRIEEWRLEQSRALLEEIEKETRRRRRLSLASAARSPTNSVQRNTQPSASVTPAQSVSDGQSVSSDEGTENLSFWERLTRRVIRDLMGIDEDTLSVIFGESLPEEVTSAMKEDPTATSSEAALQALHVSSSYNEPWEHRLLERVARELGILVHQLSEHPGAFSTYRRMQQTPEYVGKTSTTRESIVSATTSPLATSQSSPTAQFAPTFPAQPSNTYSEASLWGIEEEPEVDPLDSFRNPTQPTMNIADEVAREQEYWERELDVKMVFNFLVKRFSSRRSSISSQQQRARSSSAPPPPRSYSHTRPASASPREVVSARRAAIIRQHHPLVAKTADRLPVSSSVVTSTTNSNVRDSRRAEPLFRSQHQQMNHSAASAAVRNQVLRSSSSCASQSTKKSKRSGGSAGRNYWDMSGSVGSGSLVAGEV